jgi:signal transduction histidine kinase/DNA-binding response OmpR family regulator/Tfp pilus assembly protein PilE
MNEKIIPDLKKFNTSILKQRNIRFKNLLYLGIFSSFIQIIIYFLYESTIKILYANLIFLFLNLFLILFIKNKKNFKIINWYTLCYFIWAVFPIMNLNHNFYLANYIISVLYISSYMLLSGSLIISSNILNFLLFLFFNNYNINFNRERNEILIIIFIVGIISFILNSLFKNYFKDFFINNYKLKENKEKLENYRNTLENVVKNKTKEIESTNKTLNEYSEKISNTNLELEKSYIELYKMNKQLESINKITSKLGDMNILNDESLYLKEIIKAMIGVFPEIESAIAIKINDEEINFIESGNFNIDKIKNKKMKIKNKMFIKILEDIAIFGYFYRIIIEDIFDKNDKKDVYKLFKSIEKTMVLKFHINEENITLIVLNIKNNIPDIFNEEYMKVLKSFYNIIKMFYYIIDNNEMRKKYEENLRKSKLKAELANQTKSLFVANMNHEIRTPVNTIFIVNDLLRKMNINDEIERLVNMSRNASKNLLNIIDKMLDFSKIEQGTIKLIEKPFLLKEIIENIIKEYKIKQNRYVKFIPDVKIEDFDIKVIGDYTKLSQIIQNILNNAFKFTEEGFVKLSIKLDRFNTLKNFQRIIFIIEDTGIGIDENEQSKVFEPFYQGKRKSHNESGGTGLGLAISKEIINLMGGEIIYISKEDRGSIFKFSVLLKNNVNEEILKSPKNKENVEGIKVLLAEDNSVNREIQKMQLESLGFKVDTVKNGVEVLDRIKKHNFDIILMDISMPELDGYETTVKIREIEKGTDKHLPIIALTAFSNSNNFKKCIEMGMDDYIPKPLNEEDLIEKVGINVKKKKRDINNQKIKKMFIKDLEEKIEILKTLDPKKDYLKIADIAHQIKNPFKYLKFNQASDTCKKLEDLARNKELNDLSPFLKKIEDYKEKL